MSRLRHEPLQDNETKRIKGGIFIEPEKIAHLAAQAARDKKAENIVIMDMRDQGMFCDYFVVVSATAQRHVKAIADAVIDNLEQKGVRLHHVEGYKELLWVLLDCGATVVHVFTAEMRDFYDLERLWSNAPKSKIE